MTTLELCEFLEQQDDSPKWGGEELIARLGSETIREFADMVGDDYLYDNGVTVILLPYGDVAIDIVPLCEDFGIDPESIKKKVKIIVK